MVFSLPEACDGELGKGQSTGQRITRVQKQQGCYPGERPEQHWKISLRSLREPMLGFILSVSIWLTEEGLSIPFFRLLRARRGVVCKESVQEE